MVSHTIVKSSNDSIATALPPGLVAVFVGGTNGIGEYTLKQFARLTKLPKVYFIGRSQEAGKRIENECKELNPDGSFTFIKADTSLIRNVDEVCRDLKSRVKTINLLFLSTGTLDFYTNTSEDLRLAASLIHYTRLRFIQHLLPELQASTSLKRVVSVFASTKEGPFSIDDINGDKLGMSLVKKRGHAASLVTLGMESMAKAAPDVTFIHDFPGPVKSGIARDMPGVIGYIVRFLGVLFGPFVNIPPEQSGAYHLYFATSARYPPNKPQGSTRGVSLDVSVARGNDGVTGSGMYCIDEWGESADSTVEQQLAELRKDGLVEKVWQHTEGEWKRITG